MGKGRGRKNSNKINGKRGSSTAFFQAESFNLAYDFDLFTLEEDGQTPRTFAGALEDFNGSLTHSSIFDPNLPVFDFFQDDFDAGREQSIEFTNETSDLQASFNATDNQLEYQVTNNDQLTALGVTELSFYISDFDRNSGNGFQVDDGTVGGEGTTIDLDLATASNGVSESEAIEYIISEDLLDFDGASISGAAAEGSDEAGQIITREALFLNGTGSEETFVDPGSDPVDTPVGTPDPVIGEPPIDPSLGDEGGDGEPPVDPLLGDEGGDSEPPADPLLGDEGGGVAPGLDGDNLLNGGNGNDTLNGGEGQDVLIGGGGADIFAISALGDNDMIQDFSYGEDIIGLSDGITFDQLTVTQGDGAAILSYQDQAIASVSGATPDQISANLFAEI
jgi:Ca2+-binding RTX toxin-like protein